MQQIHWGLFQFANLSDIFRYCHRATSSSKILRICSTLYSWLLISQTFFLIFSRLLLCLLKMQQGSFNCKELKLHEVRRFSILAYARNDDWNQTKGNTRLWWVCILRSSGSIACVYKMFQYFCQAIVNWINRICTIPCIASMFEENHHIHKLLLVQAKNTFELPATWTNAIWACSISLTCNC